MCPLASFGPESPFFTTLCPLAALPGTRPALRMEFDMCAEEMRELEGRTRKRPASATTSSCRSGARSPVMRPPAVLRNLRPAGQLRPLRLGTWCSGWESIVLAMLGMRVDFEHTFACDTSAAAQARRLQNLRVCRKVAIGIQIPWVPVLHNVRSSRHTHRDYATHVSIRMHLVPVVFFPCL